MPKVSVIIPVYKVERYIERCARSLFEQTLDDIEYLFVDDCTPDRSISILLSVLEEYPNRNKQVIIHRMSKNCGQAAVREWGLQNATGTFVIHCDSDDWVDRNLYESLYDKANKENADVVICDYVVTDGLNKFQRIKGCRTLDILPFINDVLFQKSSWALWNKLYRRENYINKIVYPTGNMGEDMALCIQMLFRCNRISYSLDGCYHYFFNPLSIMNNVSVETSLRNFKSLRANNEIVKHAIFNENLQSQFEKGVEHIQFNSLMWLFPFSDRLAFSSLIKDTYSTNPFRYLTLSSISIIDKIRYILSIFRVYPYIWKIVN
jgi:glycosyltransferase involved in cell wall biosynthesis